MVEQVGDEHMTVDELRDAIQAICQEQYLNELTTDLFEDARPSSSRVSEDLLEKSARSLWGGARWGAGQDTSEAGLDRGSLGDNGIELSTYRRRRMTERLKRTRLETASADTTR